MIIYGKVAGSAETLNLDTNICSEMGTGQELSESVHAGYTVRISKRERERGRTFSFVNHVYNAGRHFFVIFSSKVAF